MTAETGTPQRTDPRSFAVRGVTALAQMVIPLGIAAATILDDGAIGDLIGWALPILLLVIGFNFAIAYLQWTRLTYTVGENDIRMDSGLLSRAARSVPYERIQDVSLEQKFVPRLFGLVEVRFETGAGGKDDMALSYLSEAEGERLRKVVRGLREGGSPEIADVAPQAQEAPPLFAMGPRRIFTFGLFEFSLVVVAVVFGALQQFDFLLPFDMWDIERWERSLAGPGQWLAGLGLVAQAVGVAFALASLAVIGVVTGVVRTVLREWGFRLDRTDKGLRRRRGLLTRTDLVMPLHRVQALRLETGFIRRRFGWHGLKVISLASDSGAANHDAVPFAQIGEIAPVVATTGFALPRADAEWHRSSAAYRFDRLLLAIPLFALASFSVLASQRWELALLPLFGGTAVLSLHEYLRWRLDRHALGARQLYTRHGWFSPSLAIASRTRLQSVEIVQGPVARWRGYASLHCGLAGGRLRVHGIPLAEALAWRDAICSSIAGTDFSELLDEAGD